MHGHPEQTRPLTFSRGESAGGRWSWVRTDPHPALAETVRLYQAYSGAWDRPVLRRELPFGDVVLILNFGPRYRMIDRATGGVAAEQSSFVAGLHDSFALVESAGIDRCMHVDFSPLGAYRLLHMPMHHFAGRTVDLSDVLGAEAGRLIDRLEDAADWHERFAVLDDWIIGRMARARTPTPELDWAWRRLESGRGALRIGELADDLGWSRKRLVAEFREQVGVPPKALGRVLRFHHALELLGDGGCDAAGTAAACGYADQAHMIREFRAISGWTPGMVAEMGWPNADGTIDP